MTLVAAIGLRRVLALLIPAILVYTALALSFALTHRPWCDEAWFANPALNLITKGTMGTTVLEPLGNYRHPKGINEYTYWIMPFHIIAQAGWYELFGFSLLSLRGLSIACGLVALLSWFSIIVALTKEKGLAVLVVALLAVDFTFLTTAGLGRMDMLSAALGFSALAAYLQWRDRNSRVAVLVSHGLVAASGLTHPVGGVLAFLALLFLTVYFDRNLLRLRYLALSLIPYVIAVGAWGLYIAQRPDLFLIQFLGNSTGRFTLLADPLNSLKLEWTERYLEFFGFASTSTGFSRIKIVVLIAYLVGTVAAICTPAIRRNRGYRCILLLTGIYTVGLLVFDSTKQGYYLVYSVTLLAVTTAVWIHWCWRNRQVPRWVLALAVGGLFSLQLVVDVYRVVWLDALHKNYLPAVQFLKNRVPEDGLVMASAEIGFGLGFEHLTDDPTLGYYTRKRADFIVVDDLNYAQFFESFHRNQPEVDRFVTDLLSQNYQTVYRYHTYQIYARRR